MKTKCAGKTDVGLRRAKNEDRILLAPDIHLFIVADGIGGQRAGEVASQMAITTMEDYWRRLKAGAPPSFFRKFDESLPDVAKHLLNSIHFANLAIFEAQKQPQFAGMGSTIAALVVDGGTCWAANVGDSRIYHYNHERLLQISQDHNLAEETRLKELFPNLDADSKFAKNALTRALGLANTVEAFIISVRPDPGDILLLCSDGLTNYVQEAAIELILSDPTITLQEKVDILVDEANKAGGGDNISVVLVELEKEDRCKRIKKRLQS